MARTEAEDTDIAKQLEQLRADFTKLARQVAHESGANGSAEVVGERVRQAADRARQMAGDVGVRVEQHPYAAMLIGAGVGLLAGLVLNARR